MKNAMENELTRDQIIAILTDMVVDADDGFTRKEDVLPSSDLVADLRIDDFNLTVLVVDIIKRFRIKPSQEEMSEVRTVGQLADLVLALLAAGRTYDPELEKERARHRPLHQRICALFKINYWR